MGYRTAHPYPQPEQQAQQPYTIPVVFGPARRAQFAYRVISVDPGTGQTLDEGRLNALGKDGWLLVSVLPRAKAGKQVVEYVFVRAEP